MSMIGAITRKGGLQSLSAKTAGSRISRKLMRGKVISERNPLDRIPPQRARCRAGGAVCRWLPK